MLNTMLLSTKITLAAAALLPSAAGPAQDAGQDAAPTRSHTVHAETLYTSAGDSIRNALIVVDDGKIAAVSPGVEATRDAIRAKVVTAGMIDASARINVGLRSVEQGSEITPEVESRFGIDPFDARWARLARSGVTTAFVAPLNQNCIGGFGTVVKTAGGADLVGRTVESARMICGAIGSQPSQRNSPAFGRPSGLYNRRPTTRMGVEWEWRQSFFDAGQTPAEDANERTRTLQDALAGRVGVFVQAWATQDIRTAVFLKEELMREGFGELQLVVDCAAEAWREIDMLKRTGTAVVLPPLPSQGRTRDSALMPLDTAHRLVEAGVDVCLSAHAGDNPGARLDVQAGFAMRGGLDRAQALRAVTAVPARVLGIADRVGTVEVGKDADLVLWNGEPFEITSRPVGVLVGGELVVDPRD
ncbi:MAG: amidohydrolase family protein [Planctomycetota bacterium]